MTGVSVVVPWRPDGAYRDAVWAYLRARWDRQHPSWQVVEGRAPDGPWCKAAAIADALTRTEGQLLVVADADVWTGGVPAAVRAVQQGAAWAIPHWHVLRLTRAATAKVLAGGHLEGEIGQSRSLRWERLPYVGYPGGGMVVLPRATYDRIPLDRRFAGWGQEDECWAAALRMLAGPPWRGEADLWHLWHSPMERMSPRWGSTDSQALCQRYRAARTPEAMRALLDEIRASTERY